MAAEEVTIHVADRVIHQMASGVGASWHSLLRPPVGHGGSAFGGTPPVIPRYQDLWTSLERHAAWLGLKFIRAEFAWRQFEPKRGRYSWDSPEMQILDRILAWAQRHGSDVLLQCLWIDTPWLAFAPYRGDPSLELYSAPSDLDAFAAGWMTLLHELRDRRGYDCIRWINLVNEPNARWWLVAPDTPGRQGRQRQINHLTQALQTVRRSLERAESPVRLMGPDMTDLPVFDRLADQPWYGHVDDVDFHSYASCFDWEDPQRQAITGAYRLGDRLAATLARYRRETAADGKGLFLTEAGTQTYGYRGDDPAPGTFKASLKDSELLIRCLNLGLDGFNRWSFTNRGDQDGQWQLVDTWDRTLKTWLEEARPHRDAFHVLGLAIRYLPHRARILETTVQGGRIDDVPRVWAAAVASPEDDSRTLLVVNDAERPWNIHVDGNGLTGPLWCLRSTPDAQLDRSQVPRPILLEADGARLTLPRFSLSIVTDSPLDPGGPGRF